MDATDVRVVLLTGTPIINYPNEIAVLYNILRGYIKTWKFNLRNTGESTIKKIDTETIMSIFKNNKTKQITIILIIVEKRMVF